MAQRPSSKKGASVGKFQAKNFIRDVFMKTGGKLYFFLTG